MAEPAEKEASYEDLLQVPDNLVAEILGGRLHTSPRPAPKHARAASSLGVEVGAPYDKQGAWRAGWLVDSG